VWPGGVDAADRDLAQTERLGVAQLGDGLVGLPPDARTRRSAGRAPSCAASPAATTSRPPRASRRTPRSRPWPGCQAPARTRFPPGRTRLPPIARRALVRWATHAGVCPLVRQMRLNPARRQQESCRDPAPLGVPSPAGSPRCCSPADAAAAAAAGDQRRMTCTDLSAADGRATDMPGTGRPGPRGPRRPAPGAPCRRRPRSHVTSDPWFSGWYGGRPRHSLICCWMTSGADRASTV